MNVATDAGMNARMNTAMNTGMIAGDWVGTLPMAVDARDAVPEAMAHFWGYIVACANRFAGGDRDLFDDLRQEAFILLWTIDVSRFDDGDEDFLKGAIYKRVRHRFRGHMNQSGACRRVELVDMNFPLTDQPEVSDDE
jgi:hypothetical protein